MKNIVIVTRNMLAGGAERVISILANNFVNNGIKVTLILLEEKDICYEVSPKVNIVTLERQSSNPVLNKFLQYKEIRQLICDEKPDIVLSMPEEIGLFVNLAMLGSGIPVVVSERNNPRVMPYKKVTRIMRRISYLFASGFVFQTKDAASFFSKRIQNKGIILKNPLNIENIPESFTGERRKVVVGVGRLYDQKNFPLLISAFSEFHKTHSDYKLVIFGEGKKRAELEAFANEMLPQGSWEMPGRSSNWLEQAKDAKMFVLSSDFEGMPNALIESMATGIPSISTDCPSGGSRELIENNINGILIPVNDKDAMVEAICKLADDSEFAETLSQNGVKLQEELNSEVICKKWYDYLERIINK